jgi:prepilin-type N-terminal cleavage/methylation domain-containing protein
MPTNHRKRKQTEKGFTLIEVMISMIILVIGSLCLAGFFAKGLQSSDMTQMQYIAQEKASEAMETIFTARDTKILSWAQIANVNSGGVFSNGPQPLCNSGPDGLFGTQDDITSEPDTITIGPGPDGVFGTSDDVVVNLNPWMTRTITITPVATTTNLNEITVTINWVYEGQQNSYTLVSYISNYS